MVRRVCKTTGKDEIILVTKKGQSIRFKEKDIRPMGRSAAGVRAIKLKKGDEVVGVDIIRKPNGDELKAKGKAKKYLLVVSENGYGKRTNIKEYNVQRRGGIGVKTAKLTSKIGDLVASKVLTTGEEKDLIAISRRGQVIRVKIDSISKLSRATQGVRIMKLDKEDKVVSIACV